MKFYEERKILIKAEPGEKLDFVDVEKVTNKKFPNVAKKITIKRIKWGLVYVATIVDELFTTKSKGR